MKKLEKQKLYDEFKKHHKAKYKKENRINVLIDRDKYIGGSDVPVIFNKSKFKTRFELQQEKAGIIEFEQKRNKYTEFGKIMEPEIRRYINKSTTFNFEQKTFLRTHPSIRYNADGYCLKKNVLLEVKTGNDLDGSFENYNLQIQLGLYSRGADYAILAFYERDSLFDTKFNENKLKLIKVERDPELIIEIKKMCVLFWKQLFLVKSGANEQDLLTKNTREFLEKVAKIDLPVMKLILLEELNKSKIKSISSSDGTRFVAVNPDNSKTTYKKVKGFDLESFEIDHPYLFRKYNVERLVEKKKQKSHIRILTNKKANHGQTTLELEGDNNE